MFSTSSGRNNGKGQPYSTIRDYSDSESDVDDGEDDFIQREIRQQRVRFVTCIGTEECCVVPLVCLLSVASLSEYESVAFILHSLYCLLIKPLAHIN
jgi:hypothetical protein